MGGGLVWSDLHIQGGPCGLDLFSAPLWIIKSAIFSSLLLLKETKVALWFHREGFLKPTEAAHVHQQTLQASEWLLEQKKSDLQFPQGNQKWCFYAFKGILKPGKTPLNPFIPSSSSLRRAKVWLVQHSPKGPVVIQIYRCKIPRWTDSTYILLKTKGDRKIPDV